LVNEKPLEVDFFADIIDTLEIDEVINVDERLLSIFQYERPDETPENR
jgi:hypothetical protein